MLNTKEKHFTASIFIFHKFEQEWKILFVHHKKFDRWMIPGGHVENHENSVEAVLREAFEETSLAPTLISFIHKELPQTDSKWLLPPEYLFEQRIPAHKENDEHFHLDCAYVSVTDEDTIKHREEESNDIQWFNEKEIKKETSMFLSTQKMALEFLKKLKGGTLQEVTTFIQNNTRKNTYR